LKTPLPRKLTFADPEKIRELARRGEALGTLESGQMLEGVIEQGRGGVYLRLTPDEYRKLRRARGGEMMRALTPAIADIKILVAAMTFFALLVVLLLTDGCIDSSLIGPGWIPAPIPG
jgi:hypothetical protein